MDLKVSSIEVLIAMIIYLAVIVGVGIFFAKRANESSDNFFIGGRKLGPWVTAMSAEASDMSGWLLMGLPGVAYFFGIAEAAWTAIGLAVGTYINWLIVAKPLRRYSVIAGNSITIPDFFSNRFKEKKPVILTIASLMILIFFAVYTGSCFVTGGKLFSAVFGFDYQLMMVITALVVIAYTFLGGFLAESMSDFIQGIVMIVALVLVFIAGISAAGGPGAVLDNIKDFPGFLDLFGVASPEYAADGVTQVAANGVPQFGTAGVYGIITVVSTMSWGLGYFGMPQVLLRFMAIRKVNELKRSRRIAVIWVVISLFAAVCIGLIGRATFPTELVTSSSSENIFIVLSTHLLPSFIAGIVMAGILAATMSSSDSYLLIASSAVARNLFKGVFKKNATDKQVMLVSRITLIAISVMGIIVALDESSVIFTIVSFAWAGFGASFGPLMLCSLFWRRTTQAGGVAGILVGAATVFIWKFAVRPLGGAFDIYELLPAFILSLLAIIIASLASKKPSEEILKEFDEAKQK
jgi:sodium/proline symporter